MIRSISYEGGEAFSRTDDYALFRPPTLIGTFEMQWDQYGKIFREPASGLRVLDLPRERKFVNFNLLDGYVPLAQAGLPCGYGSVIQNRTGIMRWMADHYRVVRSKSKEKLFDCDFITGRGTLQCLMSQTCSKKKKIEYIAATLYEGNIYLKVLPLTESVDEKSNQQSYAGLRFEDFVTRPAAGTIEPPPKTQLNYTDADKSYHVLVSKFGHHKVIYSAEFDCVSVDPVDGKLKLEDFVELKTTMNMFEGRSEKLTNQFRQVTSLKWWSQCVISGVPSILIGHKNSYKDLRVTKLNMIDVEDLPPIALDWTPTKCFQFLEYFLTCVKQTAEADNPWVIYCYKLEGDKVFNPTRHGPDDSSHYPIVTKEVIHMYKESINSYNRASQWVFDDRNHQPKKIDITQRRLAF